MSGSLPSLALAAVMLVCALATGARILTLLHATPRPIERALFALALGVGVQGTLILALSALGWLHPAALWAAVVAPALFGAAELRAMGGVLRSGRDALAAVSRLERITVGVVAVAVAVILVTGALAPVTDWDSLMYHLQLPRLFLEHGGLYVPPDGQHVAYLGLFQFLYLPLLAVGAAAGPALLNAAMAFALGLTVAVAGSRLFGRETGVLAFVAIWGSSSLFLVGATPRVDVTLIFVLFLAHYAALRSLDEDAPWATVVTALLAGIAIGLKYHALPYLVAVAPLAVWGLWRRHTSGAASARASTADLTPVSRRAPLSATARSSLVALAITLFVALPWLLKNAVLFGAPLYPFFTERTVPPFIAEIQGTSVHPPGVSTEIYSALGRAREPISLEALLRRPAALTVEAEGGLYTRNPVVFLAPLALLVIRDRAIAALLLPALVYLAITLGAFPVTNLRYLMPALPAVVLVAVESVRRLVERAQQSGLMRRLGGEVVQPSLMEQPADGMRPTLMRSLLLALALVAIFPALRVSGSRLVTPVRTQVALGILPPEAVLNDELQYVVAQYVAEQTPPDAKILMIFEARGYYYARTTIQDNVLTNWPLLVGTGAPDRCLAGTGITHILVNTGAAGYYARRGLDLSILSWDRFVPFARECLDLIIETNGVAFFRVRPRSPAAGGATRN